MAVRVWAIFCGLFGLGCLIVSAMSFAERGFVFNNAWIWASREERERMDKKPCYRQAAVAFALIAALFFCMALECVLTTGWLWGVVAILCVAVLVYAVRTSAKGSGS